MDISEFWGWYLLLLLGVLLLPHIMGPIRIHRTITHKVEPKLLPFPADHPGLPEEVEDHFQRVTEQLAKVGFEVVQGIALPGNVPKVKALLMMFANRTTKDIAMATVMYVDTPQAPKLQTAHVDIGARFRDGTLVLTNNCARLGTFSKRPNAYTTQFPMVRTADRLFRLHSQLVEMHGSGEKILRLDEEFHGDAVATLAKGMREEIEAQVANGCMYLSEQEGLFRLTWKGAILMTWKLLPPLKQIRHALLERKARRLLAELEGRTRPALDEAGDDNQRRISR
jgi:hypothetical protein